LVIKDGEAEKYQKLATEYDNQVTAYMKTISKLQVENEKLRTKLDTVEDDYQSNNTLFFILGLIIIALLFIVLRQYRMTKTKKLTKV
jgi:regulator of replication initiation timing